MSKSELPIPRAFKALMGAARSYGMSDQEGLTFVLAWLAAARMVLTGNVPGILSVEDLELESSWDAVEKAGLAVDGYRNRWMLKDTPSGTQLLDAARSAVKELVADFGTKAWDILPTLSSEVVGSRHDYFGVISPEVGELMLDMLGEPHPGQEVWIPFDNLGVMTVQALRRGWRVKTAQLVGQEESALALLLAIEFGRADTPNIDAMVERDQLGRPLTKAHFVLACPPVGMTVRGSRMAQWDSTDGEALDRFAKTETWAVHELMSRASEKAVFLLPPGVLFNRGQEQRLREHLLHRGGECNELKSVVGLYSGAAGTTTMASALLELTPNRDNDQVLMVDLGLARKLASNLLEAIRSRRKVALGLIEDPERACRVTRQDIIDSEASFMPLRYLRKTADLGPNAEALDGLCELVRSPVMSKDDNADELRELGIPELGPWRPVESGLEKKVQVKPRRDQPTLQQGDVVLSVKGTIGKVGLVGGVEPGAVVASQSCLALRLQSSQRGRVSPEYLLMFFRSELGQSQLESLKSGAVIQHVNPQTLLSSFQVPIPEPEERRAVEADFHRLCDLERQTEELRERMAQISKARWQS